MWSIPGHLPHSVPRHSLAFLGVSASRWCTFQVVDFRFEIDLGHRHCCYTHFLATTPRLREVTLASGHRSPIWASLPSFTFCHSRSESNTVFSWPRTSCLLVRLQCFLSFQTTKASLSCTPELLGICLLLNPRAHVLGRRRGRSRNTWPVSEQRVPGAPVPWLGSRSEHGLL